MATVEINISHLQLDEITSLDAVDNERATFGTPSNTEPCYPSSITDTNLESNLSVIDEASHSVLSANCANPPTPIKTDHLSASKTQGYLLNDDERFHVKPVEIDVSKMELIDH